jgi:acyl carrier protein
MPDVRQRVEAIFRELFEDDGLVLKETMTASDIDGWDSLAHINLIIAVESEFGIRFAAAEISGLKGPGQTVGSFLDLVRRKSREAPAS